MSKATIVLTGVGPGPTEFELADETIIGRSVRADIQIEGDLVSRQHARIFRRDGAWLFEDMGSRNGTLLNGVRTAAGELRDGDVLNIGYGKIVFQHDAPADSGLEVSFIAGTSSLDSAVLAEDEEAGTHATVALTYKDLVLVNQRLITISRITERFATILDRDQLLEEVMAQLFDLFPQADRGCVVLKAAGSSFRVVATHMRAPDASTSTALNISNALLELVRKQRKAVLSADTGHDIRFEDHQSMIGSVGRSVMCAPLQRDKEFYGAIYLDTETLTKPFVPSDLNLLQGIAGPVAVTLKNAELVGRVERETKMRTSLSRYLSPDIVRKIGEGSLTANLGGDQAEGTIMFSDIVGFTAMSESMKAVDVVARLNQYFHSMLEAIFGWDGTVDKFGGDAILAVWGAPVPTAEHAVLATGAALEMQGRLFGLNVRLAEAGETRIRMAVGLNSGRFVAGNIGGQDRVEWTVIGDTVNTAQRVESQGFRGCVLVSETTFAGLSAGGTGGAGGFAFPPVLVKGRTEPVSIYSIRTLKTPRGTVAALPVSAGLDAGTVNGVLVKVHPRTDSLRVTVRMRGRPATGEQVRLTVQIPEVADTWELTGTVRSSSPLLESDAGRSVDIDAEWMDDGLSRLLRAEGVADAAQSLDDIDR